MVTYRKLPRNLELCSNEEGETYAGNICTQIPFNTNSPVFQIIISTDLLQVFLEKICKVYSNF